MTLVTKDSDTLYLVELKQRLEDNGIPAFVGSEDEARALTPLVMASAGLWIYLEHQYDDALALINDPTHEVTSGVDVAAFHQKRPDEAQQTSKLMRILIQVGVYGALLALGGFFIVALLDTLGR